MRYNCLLPYMLNLLDLVLTLHALAGGAVELNPLMRCVPVMIVYKLAVMALLLWWLSRRPERLARYALTGAAALYGAVDAYHLLNLFAAR